MAQPPRAGKRSQIRSSVTHRKVGFTSGQMQRIESHRQSNEGKSWPDAVRDIFNAGCRTLGLDSGVAGTIGLAQPMKKVA